MKKTVKQLWITLLFTTIISASVFSPSASATENLPTVWVKVHRIQAVDSVENAAEGGADWHYVITVTDGETIMKRDFKCPPNTDDITLDRADSFTGIKDQEIFVKIELYDDDPSEAETADISNSGTSFTCTYNLISNSLGGDETVYDDEHYKTSGDFDGSTQKDENDANLWFAIFDNYDAPIANAGEDQSVCVGEKVLFDASQSTVSEGSSIVKFLWDFENDGFVDAEGQTVSHLYTEKGTYTCRLLVMDSLGVTSEDTCVVSIFNQKPEAGFTFSPAEPNIKDMVNFTDTSTDADGAITFWYWDFGDGTTSTARNPTHSFAGKGTWTVTLTVTDNDGETDSITKTVTVVNLPPTACFNCTPNAEEGMEFQFVDGSIDPENRTLSWFWDFGDGNTSTLQAPTHRFAAEGTYNVTLTVTDDENATDTYVMTIPVKETNQDESVPLWIIAAVVVAVTVGGFVGLVLWNRRHKSFPEMFNGTDDAVSYVHPFP